MSDPHATRPNLAHLNPAPHHRTESTSTLVAVEKKVPTLEGLPDASKLYNYRIEVDQLKTWNDEEIRVIITSMCDLVLDLMEYLRGYFYYLSHPAEIPSEYKERIQVYLNVYVSILIIELAIFDFGEEYEHCKALFAGPPPPITPLQFFAACAELIIIDACLDEPRLGLRRAQTLYAFVLAGEGTIKALKTTAKTTPSWIYYVKYGNEMRKPSLAQVLHDIVGVPYPANYLTLPTRHFKFPNAVKLRRMKSHYETTETRPTFNAKITFVYEMCKLLLKCIKYIHRYSYFCLHAHSIPPQIEWDIMSCKIYADIEAIEEQYFYVEVQEHHNSFREPTASNPDIPKQPTIFLHFAMWFELLIFDVITDQNKFSTYTRTRLLTLLLSAATVIEQMKAKANRDPDGRATDMDELRPDMQPTYGPLQSLYDQVDMIIQENYPVPLQGVDKLPSCKLLELALENGMKKRNKDNAMTVYDKVDILQKACLLIKDSLNFVSKYGFRLGPRKMIAPDFRARAPHSLNIYKTIVLMEREAFGVQVHEPEVFYDQPTVLLFCAACSEEIIRDACREPRTFDGAQIRYLSNLLGELETIIDATYNKADEVSLAQVMYEHEVRRQADSQAMDDSASEEEDVPVVVPVVMGELRSTEDDYASHLQEYKDKLDLTFHRSRFTRHMDVE